MASQPGFWDVEDRYAALSRAGDPLETLSAVVDFEIFRPNRERLKRAGAIEALFARFDDALHDRGFLAKGGQLLDATVIEVPRQRMDRQEREAVKTGKLPKTWSPKKAAHKDIQARWTLKRGKLTTSPDGQIQRQLMVPAFGYKAHTSIDKAGGLIRKWSVTPASAYDGAQLPNLIDRRNTASPVWAVEPLRRHRSEPNGDGPTARRRMRPFWRIAARSRRSTIAARAESRSTKSVPEPTPHARRIGPPSSTFLRIRRNACGSSSGQSASSGRGSKSG